MAAAGLGSVDADTRGFYTTEDTQQRSIESLKLLIKAGGDINAKDAARADAAARSRALGLERRRPVPRRSRRRSATRRTIAALTPVDSALGKAGGNSRGGARIDVHEDTATLLRQLAGDPQ